MPNFNYRNGRTYEYSILKRIGAQRYVCLRSAGSHGIFDGTCIPLDQNKPIIFIQAKRSKIGISNIEGYFKEDIEKIRQLPNLPHIIYYLFLKVDGEDEQIFKINKESIEKVENIYTLIP